MKNSINISVIIPLYNAEGFIIKTIQSALNQTYKPFEIIVVNDGSTDNSQKLVESFISNNKKIGIPIKLINKLNEGVSKTRNIGMKLASGNWIALLDSDDEWLPRKLEFQVSEILRNPDIDLIGTNRNGEVFTKFGMKKFSRVTKINSKLLLYKNFFSTPTVLLKKKVIDRIGYFDESQRYAEEGDYWIRICNKNNCYLLNESHVITGGGKPDFGFSGLSGNLKEMEKGELKNLKTAYMLNIVGLVEYGFLIVFSIAKYFRRLLIVKFRNR